MTQRARIEYHHGKKIIFLDYTGVSHHEEDKFIKELDEVKNFILSQGDNLLILVDVRNSYGSPKMMNKMKEDGKLEKPFIKKQAVVGITGMKEILLKGINLFTNINITPFKTIEEAKDWLVV